MISKELSATLGFAAREARKRRHEYVCVEHLLFAIIHDPTGIDIIEHCGGSIDNLKVSLENFFKTRLDALPADTAYLLQQTSGFQRVIQRALNHARSADKQSVSVSDILVALFSEIRRAETYQYFILYLSRNDSGLCKNQAWQFYANPKKYKKEKRSS